MGGVLSDRAADTTVGSWIAQVLLLAAAYFVSGIAGLTIAYFHPGGVLMWPAVGVALAGLILFGPRLWPGVFLGEMLLSLVDPRVPSHVYLGIAAGNSLEAWIGASLMIRIARNQPTRARPADLLGFLLIGVLGCTLISPTFALISLTYAGISQPELFWMRWLVWYLGEATGVLAVTPAIVMGFIGSPAWGRLLRSAEFWTMLAALLAATSISFVVSIPPPMGILLLLPTFPVLIWSARLGSRSVALASLLVISSATLATVMHTGPFGTRGEIEEPLLLFAYAMLMGGTALALSAVVAQRQAADDLRQLEERERQRAQHHQFLLMERERVTREMHDGLGGQLVSLLSLVERGAGTRAEVAEALRRALDDIRIVIDSLDPNTTDLPVALGKLRTRLEAQLRRNDVKLVWKIDDDPRLEHFSPEAVLHLLRIIQEGVLQTTRRAGATCVEVSVTAASPWRLHVLIDGDGQGPAPGGLAGRSIASMHSRARELGTFLRVEDAARGMRIELKPSFPVSPSRPA